VTEGPEAVVAACIDALRQSRATVDREVATTIAGVGISSPGPVDPFRGVVVEPPNLGQGFRDVPLAARVEAALELPTVLDRDTNVAALGEHRYGAARGADDFLYVTISTGIGGAIVAGGRLFQGPDGMAGELGHVPVELDGPRCGCGGIGHLEAVAAGVALARDGRRAAEGESPFLTARAAEVGLEAISARDVAEGELAGDPVAARLMRRARAAIAAACVGFVNVFNPERIVIGGSIAEHQGERLLGLVRETVAREAFHVPARRVRIVPAALGGDVSLAGAWPLVVGRLGLAAEPGGAGAASVGVNHPPSTT
jgi:glucokinase